MILAVSAHVWQAIGFLGQGLFTARFLVQWMASEKRKESVVPVSFWWLSASGSTVLVLYAAVLRDPVFLLGNLLNGFLYIRNLLLIYLRGRKAMSRRFLIPTALAVGAFVLFTAWRGLDRAIPPAWLVAGFLGTVLWSGRFVIQWYVSEREGRSIVPVSFWYVGLGGALLLLTYSVLRQKPVFILGYLFPPIPYIRNLVLIYRKEGAPAFVKWGRAVWRGHRSRPIAIAVFGILLAAFLTGRGLLSKAPAGDFLRYHRAGRMVVEGHAEHLYDRAPRFAVYRDPALPERSFRYLPAFAVLMAPLGLLPVRAAEVLWAWLNAFDYLLLLAVCWWLCRRYGARAGWMWLTAFVTIRFAWDNLSLGQVNPTVILLATAGIYLAETDRPARGGLLAGLAAVIKFTPLILLPVFAIRRRWRALGFSLAGILLFGFLLPAAVLGPGRTVRFTRTVWERQGGKLLAERKPEDVPGESLRAMSFRLLGPLPLLKQGRRVDVSLGLLDEDQALTAYRVLALALFLWLVLFAVRHRGDREAPLVWGAALAAGLLISPESRQPHFLVLALPFTALVMLLAAQGFRGNRARAAAGLCALAFALAALPSRGIAGPKAMLWFAAICATGLATILLLAALALVVRRTPEAPPAPRTRPAPSPPVPS